MTNKELKTVFSNIGMGVGFIVVYFILIAILLHWKSDFSDDGAVTVIVTVIKCVTCITGINIAFYFGFRYVEEYMKLKGKQTNYEEEEKGSEPLDPNRIEQKIDRASSVNYLSVAGGFALAAGVTLLSTWLTYYSPMLGSPARHILLIFAVLILLIGVLLIKATYQEITQSLKDNKYLRCAIWLFKITPLVIIFSFLFIF